ncbi:MAG: M3 family oligoendopeptidase [Lachnospiraceae bacterium]|nr:M3 family oligoendopeptidase [Lachnospiraceae bacterium]
MKNLHCTFKEMAYTRPDVEAAKKETQRLTEVFKKAERYEEAKEAFLAWEALKAHLETESTLASIRQSIDTRDAFYDAEETFWNAAGPELAEYDQAFASQMLVSPFRKQLEEEFGEIVFLNAEIEQKSFSPEIIPQMQEENDLTQEYAKLIASAQIPFEGGVYTLSQMTPFKNDADDARRLAAWKAEGQWYKDHQERLDAIYDRLTHLRDQMGRKLGYDGYTQLGYYRMGRNCYTKEDVERFREAVVKYLVPVADRIYRRQAERLGKEYPMSFADNVLEFRSGNPRPAGDAQAVLDAGSKFYRELSPETDEFFRTMRERELMDVLSTEGKAGGGYCTTIPEYHVPFIFANFNGTQGDVEVVTHEAGHAFEAWTNRNRVPFSTIWPTMEACEVHSMSMEFFGEEWAEDFFGKDAAKFRYSHLAGALTFIPYGTMVDHFQHIVYEHPEYTPAQRHAEWKRLLGIYMPWQKLDGEIPFYSEGEGWQRQSHIYEVPFYYIDYCLAQTVSLEFWALIREDRESAWKTYMAYTEQGGGDTFTNMLAKAGLQSPFDESCLRGVCEKAAAYLDAYDLDGIE